MTIAETIKQLRESVGMTRKEFSQHTGIPVRTLEDWEQDQGELHQNTFHG